MLVHPDDLRRRMRLDALVRFGEGHDDLGRAEKDDEEAVVGCKRASDASKDRVGRAVSSRGIDGESYGLSARSRHRPGHCPFGVERDDARRSLPRGRASGRLHAAGYSVSTTSVPL